MSPNHPTISQEPTSTDEAAVVALLRQQDPGWTSGEQRRLEGRLASDIEFADAFARASAIWRGIEDQAATPDVMRMRHEALARARRSQAMQSPSRNRGRRIAVTAVAALVMGIGLQLSPYGYHPGSYRTDIAEQRVIPLEDNSSIALDGATALRVQFNNDARTVELVDGQAQFSVAYDPARPFKVHAGELTVVALGTIFTVEQVAGRTRVILIEGRVAVLPDTRRASRLNALLDKPTPAASTDPAAYASGTMELGVGDELRLDRDGRANVTKVDLDSATAWRRGKLVFHDIPLDEAVSRMNRHSRLQIRMEDPELAALPVSGVFQAGDAGAFAHALESYLPLSADYSDSGKVSLHRDSVRKP